MTIVHPGQFYERVRDRYPTVQMAPPLEPIRETFFGEPPLMPFMPFFPIVDLPRVWFSSEDGLLVQLQADRLHLNWRSSGSGGYPHFEEVSAEFSRCYSEFEEFAAAVGLGPIQIEQAEISYVNHIPCDADGRLPSPRSMFRVWRDDQGGPEWDVPVDDLSFCARYALHSQSGGRIGRLSATLQTLVEPRVLQLDLTARGQISKQSLQGIVEFHELAHASLARSFAALTT